MNKSNCSICFSPLVCPTWNCMQAHALCKKCWKKSEACPVCTQSVKNCMYCDILSNEICSHLQTTHNFEGMSTFYSEIRIEINSDYSVYSLRRLYKVLFENEEKLLAVDVSIKDEVITVQVHSLKKASCQLNFRIKNQKADSSILFFSYTEAEPFFISLKQVRDHFSYTNKSGSEVFCIEIDPSQEFLHL
jgi:hypothetical protein